MADDGTQSDLWADSNWGVLLSAGLTWWGDLRHAARQGSAGEDSRVGRVHRIMALGALTLALSPLGRVVAPILLWWREGDYRFVATGPAVAGVLGSFPKAGR
jgi:hypothetical protein